MKFVSRPVKSVDVIGIDRPNKDDPEYRSLPWHVRMLVKPPVMTHYFHGRITWSKAVIDFEQHQVQLYTKIDQLTIDGLTMYGVIPLNFVDDSLTVVECGIDHAKEQ
jgi:hypothetical protein